MKSDVRVVALLCLTAIALAAIAGLTVAAVLTDRDLRDAGVFTVVMALCVAVMGGVQSFRPHHRWRLEREDVIPDDSQPR